MTEKEFWKYIEMINEVQSPPKNKWVREEMQIALIEQALEKLPFKETLAFHEILFKKLHELFLPKVAAVYLLMYESVENLKNGQRYLSNDGFRDFRSWIIGLGKIQFELFKNYQSEADILDVYLHPEFSYRSDLELIIDTQYELAIINENEEKVENLMSKKYSIGCDGDYKKDLIDKIEWHKLETQFPTLIKNNPYNQ